MGDHGCMTRRKCFPDFVRQGEWRQVSALESWRLFNLEWKSHGPSFGAAADDGDDDDGDGDDDDDDVDDVDVDVDDVDVDDVNVDDGDDDDDNDDDYYYYHHYYCCYDCDYGYDYDDGGGRRGQRTHVQLG